MQDLISGADQDDWALARLDVGVALPASPLDFPALNVWLDDRAGRAAAGLEAALERMKAMLVEMGESERSADRVVARERESFMRDVRDALVDVVHPYVVDAYRRDDRHVVSSRAPVMVERVLPGRSRGSSRSRRPRRVGTRSAARGDPDPEPAPPSAASRVAEELLLLARAEVAR